MLITTGKSTGYASLLIPEVGVSARAFCAYKQNDFPVILASSTCNVSKAVSTVEPAHIYNENADIASSAYVSAELPAVEADDFSFDGSAGLDDAPVIGVESDLTECGIFKLCTERDISSFCITVRCCEAAQAAKVVCAVRRTKLLRRMWKCGRSVCVLTQKFRI